MTDLPAAERSLRRTFRAFQNANYRMFWIGQVISLTGTWMQRIGQAWLVLRLTGSPVALGMVTAAQFTPILLTSLLGGVLADRFPKRRVLIVTQAVQLGQAVLLAALSISGTIRVEHIYLLAAMLGLAQAVDNPTRQAFIVELVGPDDLPNAVALNSAQFNAARIVGPALGGLAIATIGVSGCFTLNAVSFLGTLGSLLLMRPDRFFAVPARARGHVLRQVQDGLRYAARTPDIMVVLIIMAVLGTFGYNFTVLLPLIATYVLHTGPLGFGALTSAMAVGSLIAAVRMAYIGRATRTTLLIGGAGFSLALLGLGLSRWWLATVPILMVLGLFSITFTATANTRLQLVAPPQMRGRIMSLYTLLFAGTTPIGSLAVGWLASRYGVRTAIVELAGVCLLGVGAALLYIRAHQARLAPSPPEPLAGAEVRAGPSG